MAWRAQEARFLTCAGVIFNVKRCGRNRWPGELKSPFSDLCWRIFNVKRCDKVFPCWSFSGRAPPCRQGSADKYIDIYVITTISNVQWLLLTVRILILRQTHFTASDPLGLFGDAKNARYGQRRQNIILVLGDMQMTCHGPISRFSLPKHQIMKCS